ncbi:MAG: hypothetical protein WC436_01210 [Candidatus Babeliales bacterium]
MFKKTLSMLFIVFTFVNAFSKVKVMEIEKSNLFVPSRLGEIRVFHDKYGFHIIKDEKIYDVQNCFVDKEIRSLSNKKLSYFLGTIKDVEINGEKITFTKISGEKFENIVKELDSPIVKKLNTEDSLNLIKQLTPNAYLFINQMSDGEYCIHAKTRLLGGGPICGFISYWLTKTLCYGTAVAATSTIVVATGGAAGAAVGAATAAATLGASAGATVVGGAIAGAGLAAEAAVATGTAVTAVGGITATVAAVETASTAVGAFFTAIPFLP